MRDGADAMPPGGRGSHAGKSASARTLPHLARLTATSQRHLSHGSKRQWHLDANQDAWAEDARTNRYGQFPVSAVGMLARVRVRHVTSAPSHHMGTDMTEMVTCITRGDVISSSRGI